jgi:capsular polysaccharide biosynthesis protein
MSQLNLESQSEQANVHVLSPAIEPVTPSKPDIPRFILASLLGGVLAGIAAALGLEFLDRRVRVAADIAVENVPLLGILTPRRGIMDRWRHGAAGF